MRGLEGIVVLNSTEKPKSADYKQLGLNSNDALKILRFEISSCVMPSKRELALDSSRTSTPKRSPARHVSPARHASSLLIPILVRVTMILMVGRQPWMGAPGSSDAT